jgi:hypothetical protein
MRAGATMAIGNAKTQAGEPETSIRVIPRNAKDLGFCLQRRSETAQATTRVPRFARDANRITCPSAWLPPAL